MFPAKTLAAALLLCTGAAAAQPVDSGETPSDLVHLRDSDRAAYHGHYTDAVARITAVIAHSPGDAEAYLIRAHMYIDMGHYAEASADLDRVAQFHPDAAIVPLTRATIFVRQRNGKLAEDALVQASRMPQDTRWKASYEGTGRAPGTSAYHYITEHTISLSLVTDSIAEELLGHDDAAVDALDSAVKRENGYAEHVLAAHCYDAAVAGLLEMAELTCTQAIERETHDTGAFDSLGFVHARMKKWDDAIADYTKSLAVRPDLTLSLYGRGLAKRAKGDLPGADADMAAAKQGEPDIANIMARLGINPT